MKDTAKIELTEREQDIQKVCNAVITTGIHYAGDSGSWCPFCQKDCYWGANDVSDIDHEPDCIVLIAKDLTTNL